MYQIVGRLKNICDGIFLGYTHEVKTQFIILPHCFTLPPPRGKIICSSVRPHVFVNGDLYLYAIVLGKDGIFPHWCFDCMLASYKWRNQGHIMGTKWNFAGLKLM